MSIYRFTCHMPRVTGFTEIWISASFFNEPLFPHFFNILFCVLPRGVAMFGAGFFHPIVFNVLLRQERKPLCCLVLIGEKLFLCPFGVIYQWFCKIYLVLYKHFFSELPPFTFLLHFYELIE